VDVTEADKTAMRTPVLDPYAFGADTTGGSGAAIDVSGTATRGATTKTFHLVYRRRAHYIRCTAKAPPESASATDLDQTLAWGDPGPSVDLAGNQDVAFDLRIEPEAILRDDINPSAASLRFDPFAAADVDGDGDVSLEELRGVPIATMRDAGAFEAGTYEIDDAGLFRRGRPVLIESLGDFVYELLLPTLPRFRDVGWCVAFGNRPHGPD
jgi:hypothetical protein